MAQRLIHRPARSRPPEPDLQAVELLPAPALPDSGAGLQGVMQILMPIMGGAGSIVMIVANANPVMLIAGGIMIGATIIGAIVMFIAQRTGTAKRGADLRRRYLDYLDRVRTDLGEAGTVQREVADHHHPPPATLPEVARDPLRLWERRPADPDFLTVRVGTGSAPLWQRVAAMPARDPLAEPDIVTAAAVVRITERDRMVGGMPVGLPLSGRVTVVGVPAAVRDAVTVALAQLATLHGPQDLRIVTCVPRRAAGWLDWLKWLPHALSDEEVDGTAPRRLVAETDEQLADLLQAEFSRRVSEATRTGRIRKLEPAAYGPALVVIVDGMSVDAADPLRAFPGELNPAALGINVVTLVDQMRRQPDKVDVRLSCVDGTVTVEDLRTLDPDDPALPARRRALGASSGEPDRIDAGTLAGLVRELTAVRLVEETAAAAPLEATLTLEDLVGVADPGAFEPERTWVKRPMPEFLRVPFGLGPSGEKVYLDIKENALGGMGPHGLCVGATGSGKSEVLRTIVLCLAISHPSERLAMVLVDYKGGATFAGLENLPHCAAMISNLSDDDGLVDRLHDALFGEMKRRQQVLAEAGNLPNITEYNRRRDALGGRRPSRRPRRYRRRPTAIAEPVRGDRRVR